MAAIYQWIVDDGVTVTTTLYPVESSDGVEFAVDLGYSVLREMHNSDVGFSVAPINGELNTILLTVDVGPTDMGFSVAPIDGEMFTILNDRTPDPSLMGFSVGPLDGVLTTQLVTIQAPPRGAEFSITLGTCSLDPV